MIDNKYQSEANISCLFEDKEYSDRCYAILEVLRAFKEKNVHFGLACSFNLFLRGIVDEFHDFDIIIDNKDVDKVKKIMENLGAELIATGGNGFCESEVYMNFHLGRVDFDIISGFKLLTFGTQFIYHYNEDEIEMIKIYENETIEIPLISLEALYLLYAMMEGWQPKRRYKRVLIQEMIEKNNVKFAGIFHNALEEQELPGWLKREVRKLLSLDS